MSSIAHTHARQIFDSRRNPTIEFEVYTSSGAAGLAAVPSEASAGSHEAIELRDNDKKRYLCKGFENAVSNVNSTLNTELNGIEVTDQHSVDLALIELDGSSNKTKQGANAIIGFSLAAAKAAASETGKPLYRYVGGVNSTLLPVLMMNILIRGSNADNSIDFQEIMIRPVNATSFSESLRIGTEVFHALKSALKTKEISTNVGDEGGFAPDLKSNVEAIDTVIEAIEKAGYRPWEDIWIAMDAAASESYITEEGVYHFKKSTGDKLSSSDLVEFWADWRRKHPVFSIEDDLADDDWSDWKSLTDKIGGNTQLVWDDLLVKNCNQCLEI